MLRTRIENRTFVITSLTKSTLPSALLEIVVSLVQEFLAIILQSRMSPGFPRQCKFPVQGLLTSILPLRNDRSLLFRSVQVFSRNAASST